VAGKTEAKLNLLAVRRVQFRIDRELKKAAHEPSAAPGPSRTVAPNDKSRRRLVIAPTTRAR
jgi:hypothetical protein